MSAQRHGDKSGDPHTVIFLGAGASAADGAPLQKLLFRQYFSAEKNKPLSPEIADDLTRFFKDVFFAEGDPTSIEYPTFEEALGLLDFATLRGEALRELPLEQEDGPNIRSLRRELVLAMAEAISTSSRKPVVHQELIRRLRDQGVLSDILFLSTNYDILIDNALEAEAVLPEERKIGTVVDYGLGDLTHRSSVQDRETRSFPLLKIHGSLNWLYCSVCTELATTYGMEGVMRLITNPETARCPRCATMRDPVIVPPTYYKDLSNVYLSVVWNQASRKLRTASHIIMCGYSLPDADMHIKYLLKSAQINRDISEEPLQFTLVTSFTGKSQSECATELNRYSRMFGEANVRDSGLSFETFASNPKGLLS